MHLYRLAAALALGAALLVHVEAAAQEISSRQWNCAEIPAVRVAQGRLFSSPEPPLQPPVFPAEGARVVFPYGFEGGKYRGWAGLEAGSGSPVRSILSGLVVASGGDSVVVAAGRGTEVAYSGLLPAVREGDSVNAGQPLGTATGGLLTVRATRGGLPYDILGMLFPDRVPQAGEALRVEAERRALAEELARRTGMRQQAFAAGSASSAGMRGAARGGRPGAAYLDRLLADAALRYGLDPDLVRAVARVESGLDPRAVSPDGAMGVMQLMPGTARSLGVSDPFDAAQNVEGGVRYLRRMLDRFGGSLDLALAAYNAGPVAVERYGGVPPYAETEAYIRAVKAGYAALKGERR